MIYGGLLALRRVAFLADSNRFSSNYVPTEFSASTTARMIYMVYSDYYHERTNESDYRQSRSIRSDHGMELFGDEYPEAEWNADINFFMQCT